MEETFNPDEKYLTLDLNKSEKDSNKENKHPEIFK